MNKHPPPAAHRAMTLGTRRARAGDTQGTRGGHGSPQSCIHGGGGHAHGHPRTVGSPPTQHPCTAAPPRFAGSPSAATAGPRWQRHHPTVRCRGSPSALAAAVPCVAPNSTDSRAFPPRARAHARARERGRPRTRARPATLAHARPRRPGPRGSRHPVPAAAGPRAGRAPARTWLCSRAAAQGGLLGLKMEQGSHASAT